MACRAACDALSPPDGTATASSFVAWEPPEWVAARGRSAAVESAHFTLRWCASSAPPLSPQEIAACLSWLEIAWARLCETYSPHFLAAPYDTPFWSRTGSQKWKMNCYVASGLSPHPCDACWAHQGTWAEERVESVRHANANLAAKVHHSYLALQPGAARCEATVVHEFTHCVQMHTGGHVDTPCVGWQWEAGAEYAVHLHRRGDACWAHNVGPFLASAHLPPGATRSADDGCDGRQYIVWPFFSWVDTCFGDGGAHALWRADFAHRRSTGAPSRPVTDTLPAVLGADALHDAAGDWGASVASAHFSRDASANAATRCAADALTPSRLGRLRRAATHAPESPAGGAFWAPEGASWAQRPLRQHGVLVYRVDIAPPRDAPLGDGSFDAPAVRVAAASSPGGCGDLSVSLVAIDAGSRAELARSSCRCDRGWLLLPQVAAAPSGCAWLLSVTASPAQPQAVPWGVAPTTLRPYPFVLQFRGGVAPHAHSLARVDAAPPPRPTSIPSSLPPSAECSVAVPTSLGACDWAHPDAGGACPTATPDLRSGCPGETNTVWFTAPIWPPSTEACTLVGAEFGFRTVVGYSSCPGSGPVVQLVMRVECDDDDNDGSDGKKPGAWAPLLARLEAAAAAGGCGVVVLYSSPPHEESSPYVWDAPRGHATNYCPPVAAAARCCVRLQRGARVRLGLRFVNRARNVHVVGPNWPRCEPLDLCLVLRFAA